MFYSYLVAVAGILLAGPVGKSKTGAEALMHSGNAEAEPGLEIAQPRERTHASMKTDKERDLQGTETSASTLDTAHTMEGQYQESMQMSPYPVSRALYPFSCWHA